MPAGAPGRRRRLVVAVTVAAGVVVADQVSKSLAEAHLHRPRHLLGPLGLSLGFNTGSAFSLFTGLAGVLAVVAAVLVAVLVLLAWRTSRTSVAVGLGLMLGGALGNLSDRLVRGHHGAVVDFISLRYWPTFNVADACIVAGVVVLLVVWWRQPARTPP
ncbi:MAG TPA: signal peptidase II [Acidimicrobiales bacterium]|nr:signal peptidase II [Acidimicrobiales bacterium]